MQDLIHANAAGNAVIDGVDKGGADRRDRDGTHEKEVTSSEKVERRGKQKAEQGRRERGGG